MIHSRVMVGSCKTGLSETSTELAENPTLEEQEPESIQVHLAKASVWTS